MVQVIGSRLYMAFCDYFLKKSLHGRFKSDDNDLGELI